MCFNHSQTHSPNSLVSKASSKGSIQETNVQNRRGFVKALAGGGAAAALASCTTNPVTGRSQFVGLAPSGAELDNMAAASWADLKQETPTTNDPRYTRRLRNIGSRISRGAGRADQTWDYAVFDEDTKNAFVLPGNRVGFYTGMMDFADNDDQIAGIMGHEVGHVAASHARERMSMQIASQGAVLGGTLIGSSVFSGKCKNMAAAQRRSCLQGANRNTQMLVTALGLGSQIGIVLPYSRKHETESDLLGVNYMHKSGYDPNQAVRLWEKMAADTPSRQPAFLSTHPDPADRARVLSEYIQRQERMGSQGFRNINT
ncbi:M48 family metallopeptidase [Litorimonas haliclonae]|uniref:M48 family metallopeptidase n=1 Tax=Litorimonas haliclonae TaxID=2081977 RepID=UPI0039EDF54B